MTNCVVTVRSAFRRLFLCCQFPFLLLRKGTNMKGTENKVKNSVGARIRKYRLDRGLTQEELADQLGIVKSMVSYYENDKVDLKRSVLEDIARALKVSVSCLMEEDEETLDEAELLAAFRKLKSKKLREYAIKSIVSMSDLENGT